MVSLMTLPEFKKKMNLTKGTTTIFTVSDAILAFISLKKFSLRYICHHHKPHPGKRLNFIQTIWLVKGGNLTLTWPNYFQEARGNGDQIIASNMVISMSLYGHKKNELGQGHYNEFQCFRCTQRVYSLKKIFLRYTARHYKLHPGKLPNFI